MDYLKTRAPFWKKVERPDGGSWVDVKSTDDAAADRWTEHRPAAE
jgi:molybdopterin synthase catalytic subunit